MRQITVTDTNTHRTNTIHPYNFTEIISHWFPEAPAEVEYALENLGDLLPEPTWDPKVEALSGYLGLEITR